MNSLLGTGKAGEILKYVGRARSDDKYFEKTIGYKLSFRGRLKLDYST